MKAYEYLQVNVDTICRLIGSNQLAATRVGTIYRLRRSDLEEFLMANRTRPEVRAALFRRVSAIGERNPDLDGDILLEMLEAEPSSTPQSIH